ncbi:MAG TPA: AAA family ATPase [Gaiellaceae bacterium]|nr:AAA family ATPase [Gaiellaceae bacterium]
MVRRRRQQTPLAEVIALGERLAATYPWVDADELEHDEVFARLVELLADTDGIDGDAFAEVTLRGAKFLRAGALAAIAAGRAAPAGLVEGAEGRFRRAEWGERQLLLRALARTDGKVVPAVLATAEEDWSGSPIAREVARFLDARVAAGEDVTAAELGALDARLQPLVGELVDATAEATRAVLRPALEEWQTTTIDVDFFRELGRVVDPGERPPATLAGSRMVAVEAVAGALSAPRPRSVLLVGEPGVGKTTLIVEALRRLGDDWFAFQAGAADVNAGQAFIGMLEGRVQEIVGRLAGRPIAWVFPSFEEALWSGQHLQSPRGVLDALLPHVESGDAVVIGEIDPLAYELVVQHRPRVARLFEVIRLAPMADAGAIEVAREWSAQNGIEVDDETLAEALDLATHYLPATASPGNLLRVLELVRDRVERGVAAEVSTETVIATLSDATGLPLHVLDPRTPLDLERVRAHFESRVLGQPDAVECLVDRIALVKAGLTDPTRPLGVFLFVGPTGTGKTEIAKAFSGFVFGSEDRLVRLDMSEYQTPESLDRLLGDAATERQAAPLIAQVRKQPFSVLLLDEFEKAHPQIWDLFLQVFDDGRLTDRNGRTVDLRHCVIILTSNLGSAIPTGPGVGFVGTSGRFDAADVVKSVGRSFRPEFLNRLDRVVVFRPLGRDVMRGLLEKELTDVLRRRGFRMQSWAVEWDEAAIDFLIEQGFSAELGARPLKRAVEQHLLTRLATTIVERKFPEGDQFLFITARERTGLDVVFVDPDADDAGEAPPPAQALTLARVALDPEGSPVEVGFLRTELREIADQVKVWVETKDDALAQTREPGFWDEAERRSDVLTQIEYLDRLAAATATAERLGVRLAGSRGTFSRDLVALLARRLHVLRAALRGLAAGEPSDARISIRIGHGDDADLCARFGRELAAMYVGWAEGRGMRIRTSDGAGEEVLTVSGLGAYTLLRSEAGLHILETPSHDRAFDRVSVVVAVSPVGPAGPGSESGAEPAIVRRYRHEPSPLVRDASGVRTGRIDRVLGGDFDLVAEGGAG